MDKENTYTNAKGARKKLDDLLAEDSRLEYELGLKIYLDRFEERLQQAIINRKSEIIISVPGEIAKEFEDFLKYNNYLFTCINSQPDIDNRTRLYLLSVKF